MLIGKLYAHEDWLGLSSDARELLVTASSWALDHNHEDGTVPSVVLYALSYSLGHGDCDHSGNATSEAIEAMIALDWAEMSGPHEYRLLRWDDQASSIRKARERREKERVRYLKRKQAGAASQGET